MLLSFDDSAFKHGISQNEIKEAIADPAVEEFEIESSRHGNYRIMYVGFTLSGKLLEIGVECIDSIAGVFIHIHHANQATLQFRKLYNQAKKTKK